MFTVRRALLSVSDKRGLIPFAQGLAELGIEIVSTGGTCRTLRDAGLEVLDVAIASLHPPQEAAAAFHAVVTSEQENATAIEAARRAAIRTLAEAAGVVEPRFVQRQQVAFADQEV